MSTVIDAEVVNKVPARSSGDMFLPAMRIEQAVTRYNAVLEFTKEIMKDGKDFGTVPGSDKPCLLKPGAEKLCSFFGFTPRFEIVEKAEDWTGADHGGEPFFYYHYRAQLWRGDYLLGEAEGSCNSMESKYRYRWVSEDQIPANMQKSQLRTRGGRVSEPAFAIDKGETGGKYGKPADYWQRFRDAISNGTAVSVKKPKRDGGTMDAWEIDTTLYRVPNPDVADQVNTIQKMAQKRALVAATLIACNASEYYTQDLDDADYIEPHHSPASTQSSPPKPASNGTSKPTLSPEQKAEWFTRQIATSHEGVRNANGDWIRTPEKQLDYLAEGIAKQAFAPELSEPLLAAIAKKREEMALDMSGSEPDEEIF